MLERGHECCVELTLVRKDGGGGRAAVKKKGCTL